MGKERGLTKQLKIEASWGAAQTKKKERRKKKTRRKRERGPSPAIMFTLAVFPNRTAGSGYIKPTMAFSI